MVKVFSNICYLPMPQADSHSNCRNSNGKLHKIAWLWVSECKCAFVTGNSIKISSNLICVYSLLESVCAACEVWALNCCYLCCCSGCRSHLSDVTFLSQTQTHTTMHSFMHIQLPICIEFDMNRFYFFGQPQAYSNHYQWHRCVPHTHIVNNVENINIDDGDDDVGNIKTTITFYTLTLYASVCVCVWIDASMSFVTTYKYIILYNVSALSSQPFPFYSSFDVFPIHAFLSTFYPRFHSFILDFAAVLSRSRLFFHIHVILFMHAVHSASHFVYINVIDSLTLTPWPIKSFNIALTCNRTWWVPSFSDWHFTQLNRTETETKPLRETLFIVFIDLMRIGDVQWSGRFDGFWFFHLWTVDDCSNKKSKHNKPIARNYPVPKITTIDGVAATRVNSKNNNKNHRPDTNKGRLGYRSGIVQLI